MEQYVNYAGTQLMGRCVYNPNTGKAEYESYNKYYNEPNNKELFK